MGKLLDLKKNKIIVTGGAGFSVMVNSRARQSLGDGLGIGIDASLADSHAARHLKGLCNQQRNGD